MLGWLYPVRHKICVSCCLPNAIITVAIKIRNACCQLCETVSRRNICMLLDCKTLSFNCVVCNCAKAIRQGYFSVYPLGATEYPWKLLVWIFSLYLTERSKFHFTTILAPCLPSITWHTFCRATRSYR